MTHLYEIRYYILPNSTTTAITTVEAETVQMAALLIGCRIHSIKEVA